MCFSSQLHDRISQGACYPLVLPIGYPAHLLHNRISACTCRSERDAGLRGIPHVMALGFICARSGDRACAIIDRAAWSAT